MAEGNGATEKDLLLKLMVIVERLENQQRGLQASIDKVDTKLNNTNGTMALIGRVVGELGGTVKDRIDDHEKRLRALEVRAP